MNDIKPIPNYSVEIISQLRAQKKQELRESKERIQLLTQELFSPQKSKNKMENMINYIKHGLVKKRNNIRITLGCARPFLVI